MYNLDVGEHYYTPMTNYLEAERGTRGETPGALTFDERLSRNWLHGRRYEATEARDRYVPNVHVFSMKMKMKYYQYCQYWIDNLFNLN